MNAGHAVQQPESAFSRAAQRVLDRAHDLDSAVHASPLPALAPMVVVQADRVSRLASGPVSSHDVSPALTRLRWVADSARHLSILHRDPTVKARAALVLGAVDHALAVAVRIEIPGGIPDSPAAPVQQDKPVPHRSESAGASPSAGTARKVLAMAVQLLPPEVRPRFDEEFRSELHHLALAGASVAAQLRYALNQINMALEHRTELRKPARKSARS